MNRLVTTFSRLAVIAAVGFAFASCTQEDTTTGPGTTGNVVTTVAASSRNETSINLAWHRPSTDVTADTIYVMANGAVLKTIPTSSTDTSAIVTGLTVNQLYTFSVHNSAGASNNNVTWATAYRTNSVRIYETFDPTTGHPSGIVLNGNEIGAGNYATPVSVGASSQNRLNADLVLASVDNSNDLWFQAAAVEGSGLPTGKNTRFSHFTVVPGGMDNQYYTGDLRSLIATTGSDTVNSVRLDNLANNGNPLVFDVLTADNHFARVQVEPQSNGSLVGGTVGTRYIDVTVSYQPLLNTPYASRPLPLTHVRRIPWTPNF